MFTISSISPFKILEISFRDLPGIITSLFSYSLFRSKYLIAILTLFKATTFNLFCLISKSSPVNALLLSASLIAKIVWLIISFRVNWDTEIIFSLSIEGIGVKSSGSLVIISNLAWLLSIKSLLSSFNVSLISSPGSFLTISENIFALIAMQPISSISPLTIVSIANSISLAQNLIIPSVASTRIHSIIGIAVLVETAFITILILSVKSLFLKLSFIWILLCIYKYKYI